MSHLIQTIVEYLAGFIIWVINELGYVGVGLMMCIESCNIPLPSEIIMPFSGFLVSQGKMNLWWAGVAGSLGGTIGSQIGYAIGYFGGRPFVEKYGKYFFITHHELDLADRWIARWGSSIAFTSRLLPVIRTFISTPLGIVKAPFWQFSIYTFVGSLPWCWFLAYIGKVLGDNWRTVGKYFHRADILVLIVVAGCALAILAHLYKSGRLTFGRRNQPADPKG
jgi:membrane protein DedA with SNARE-associated domain